MSGAISHVWAYRQEDDVEQYLVSVGNGRRVWMDRADIQCTAANQARMRQVRREYLTRIDEPDIGQIDGFRSKLHAAKLTDENSPDFVVKRVTPKLPGAENERGAPVYGLEGGRASIGPDEPLTPTTTSRAHLVGRIVADPFIERLKSLKVFGLDCDEEPLQEVREEARDEAHREALLCKRREDRRESPAEKATPRRRARKATRPASGKAGTKSAAKRAPYRTRSAALSKPATDVRIEGVLLTHEEYRLYVLTDGRPDDLTLTACRERHPAELLDFLISRFDFGGAKMCAADAALLRRLRTQYNQDA